MLAKICEIFIHLKFHQPSLLDVDIANKPKRRMPARLKIGGTESKPPLVGADLLLRARGHI